MYFGVVVFLRIRRPPRSTLDRSSAASDVYKRQALVCRVHGHGIHLTAARGWVVGGTVVDLRPVKAGDRGALARAGRDDHESVSYTHLRAHETVLDLVCRLLLEKKKNTNTQSIVHKPTQNHHNLMSTNIVCLHAIQQNDTALILT